MKLKKILSLLLASSVMGTIMVPVVKAEELYYEIFDMTSVKADSEDGIVKEVEVPDGDYTVTVTTGGDSETNANIYINGGERVRAYTLEAGKTQENEQSVIPKDGKITVQVIGENPNVTEIEIKELPSREKTENPTIYIAGDSTAQTYNYETVYPQTGWGQMFSDYFTDEIKIENRAMAGRSSKSYDNDGRLDKILTEMCPGDYVFIQFGINDGAENKPERYISVEDYKKLITEKYMGEVEKRGGIPVLMTASAAGWWDEENNNFMESRQDYADPTREIAEETGCKFIDINRLMTDKWNTMDKNEVLSGYFVCEMLESKAYPVGTNDTTHMKAKGADLTASLVAEAVKTEIPELSKYLKGEEVFTDITGHWAETYVKALSDKGIIEGDGNGKFNPEDTVTRGEFLKMAMDAAGIVGHAYREGECLDAENSDWYCYYLQGALDKDLIPEKMIDNCTVEKVTKTLAEETEESEAVTVDVNVYTGEFNGDTAITREEMAVIAINCLSYAIKNAETEMDVTASKGSEDFLDDDIDEAYINSVDGAVSYGLVEGMGDGTFAPKENLTRAQAVTVINRLLNLLK